LVVQRPDLRDEIDFKDLLKNPGKLFGYSYFYILGVLMLLGVFYSWNLNTLGRNAVMPLLPADSSVFVRDIPLQAPAVLPPVDVLKAGVTSDSMVTRGGEVFRANCTSCHGENGMGDGPAGATMNPHPRDFHATSGWTNGAKVSQIFRTLTEGIVRNGMASFSYLPPRDRFALAHFIRRFNPSPPADTPDDLQQLETAYQLSRGMNTPGQIPVRKATLIILAEEKQGRMDAAALLVEVNSDSSSSGAKLLHSAAFDVQRVITGVAGRTRAFTGVEDFKRCVSADPFALGFRPGILAMSNQEWSELYRYIATLRKNREG
jgi:mono/diheme cytochrome c family protein